ncbi:MAG: coproporphyrinogen dehydrogenase HemZ [Eubacteriaceae bacterium]|nr:coproporphyrinogen dehydrogenase HemZ [Eubacteriaceae bacterium]
MIELVFDKEVITENIRATSLTETADLFIPYFSRENKITVVVSGDTARASFGCRSALQTGENAEYAAKGAIFRLLRDMTGYSPAWGSLTGVKPLKMYTNLIERGRTPGEARAYMEDVFMVSAAKMDLLEGCRSNQYDLLYPPDGTVSLYMHIPLCLSKCTYCSFPSAVTPEGSQMCEAYLKALSKELKAVRAFFQDKDIDCVYVGGGTPSIFSVPQIVRLLDDIHTAAPTLKELTFEAGRADTLYPEKFRALSENGVTRISINPQTANDATLARINRATKYSDYVRSFQEARDAGIGNINCDLIFGLEDEEEEDCMRSLNEIIKLGPECITVHSLCKKRTSALEAGSVAAKGLPVARLQDIAREILRENGYGPYYTYRQKAAVDNAENTGYSVKGSQCVYNIRMMGEKQTVISAGAGSTTKLYFPSTDRFENIYNMKNVELYTARIDEVIEKKLKAMERQISKG